MCANDLTWNLVGQIAVLVFIALIVCDLLIRYLDNQTRGILPWSMLGKMFFIVDDTSPADSVDEKYPHKQ